MDIGMRAMRRESADPKKRARMDMEGVESASRLGPIRARDAPRDKHRIEAAVLPFSPSGAEAAEEKWASKEARNTTRGRNEIDVGSATKAKTLDNNRDWEGRYGCRLELIPCDIATVGSQSSQGGVIYDSKGIWRARSASARLFSLRSKLLYSNRPSLNGGESSLPTYTASAHGISED